jgi:hypothetical protein
MKVHKDHLSQQCGQYGSMAHISTLNSSAAVLKKAGESKEADQIRDERDASPSELEAINQLLRCRSNSGQTCLHQGIRTECPWRPVQSSWMNERDAGIRKHGTRLSHASTGPQFEASAQPEERHVPGGLPGDCPVPFQLHLASLHS